MKLNFKSLSVLFLPLVFGAYGLNSYADIEVAMTNGSRLIKRVQVGAPYYVLPISSMRKVNGIIAAEKTLYLSGYVSASTWEMTHGMEPENAHSTILSQLQEAGAKVLFNCHGRACGSSNQWANQVFHESSLYGLDSEQSYTALKQKVAHGVDYYALYTTKKGNRKVYLHLEHLQSINNNIGQ